MPEIPNYDEGFAAFGLGPLYEKIKDSDWSNPEEAARALFEEVMKFDYRSTYAKFMALSAVFWAAPEEVQGRKSSPTSEAERAFDLLWLSYERWIAQSLTNYAQVAVEAGKFYSQLRWGTATHQANSRTHGYPQQIVATEMADYLERIRALVKDSCTRFEAEVDIVSKHLNDIRDDKSTGSEVAPPAPAAQTDGPLPGRRHRTKL
jgi:hypothetical protein